MKQNKNSIQIFNKENAGDLIPKLKSMLNKFSTSEHRLSENYSSIDFDRFEEVSIVTYNNDILGFASILSRDFWPKNIVRIFNRFWKNKSISIDCGSSGFGFISELIYNHQISFCKKKNYDYVFISIERNLKYLTRWMLEANRYDKGWIMCNEQKQVCKASSSKCIHYVIYKRIGSIKSPFPL